MSECFRLKARNKYSVVTFRLDDISQQMDDKKFLICKDLFQKYGIKPLVGVVPDNNDKNLNIGSEITDFWEMILALKQEGWSVAQHGHNHIYTTSESGLFSLNRFSEFAGLPYEQQYHKIREGKKILQGHGIETDIFMPPAHSMDENTIRALINNGFKYVTDGRSKYPYIRDGLKFIPCRDHEFRSKRGLVTICIHSNGLIDSEILHLESFILGNRDKIIDFSEALTLPPECYFSSRIDEMINLYFIKYAKPLIYPIYDRIRNLL